MSNELNSTSDKFNVKQRNYSVLLLFCTDLNLQVQNMQNRKWTFAICLKMKGKAKVIVILSEIIRQIIIISIKNYIFCYNF